jgi:hypothetical protein
MLQLAWVDDEAIHIPSDDAGFGDPPVMIVAETNDGPVESRSCFWHGKTGGIFAQRARGGRKNKHKSAGLWEEIPQLLSQWKTLQSRGFRGASHLLIFKRDFTVA